jgi:glutamyl-Q tRNA(Asp) synthetase
MTAPTPAPPPSTRFAPSTTGVAHPGTLLSALLCWLDARSRGARVDLRLEDIDRERSRPEFITALPLDLEWFGLDWDRVVLQSERRRDHEAALDALAAAGRLYPCLCSRARVKGLGRIAPDGGFAYDNACRHRPLPPGGWRGAGEPIRLRLPDDAIDMGDEAGFRIRQVPGVDMGDPVVVRRDGAVAYHLAVVADDAAAGYGRLIRGRDLAASAPTQILIYRLLGRPVPAYRHHLLVLEPRGEKLAKFHGAVGVPELRGVFTAPELCGLLAHRAGLRERPDPVRPPELVGDFDWSRVRTADVALRWSGRTLE